MQHLDYLDLDDIESPLKMVLPGKTNKELIQMERMLELNNGGIKSMHMPNLKTGGQFDFSFLMKDQADLRMPKLQK